MSTLTYIIGLPLLMAVVLAFVPRNYRFAMRLGALAATFLSLVLAVKLFIQFDPAGPEFQFTQKVPWVASLGISYYVGVDGINVGLILMGAVVAFAAACMAREIVEREKDFYVLLLVMTGGILGAFASLDLFFFFFFHELALIPTFIMIGIWGRGADRTYATFQITLYLTVGALISLVGLIALYIQAGARTFDIVELIRASQTAPISSGAQHFIFPWLLFGFGILVSLWPFHTWAPLGYGAAPTATAMLHAGVLKKFGLYGLIRVALPLLPEAARSWAEVIAWLSLGNIVFVGLVAMRQKDLLQLLGNSSVAHMGFAFLGIASLNLAGVSGAVVVMIAHGLLAAAGFALAGHLVQQSGRSAMDEMGGYLKHFPFVGTALIMAMMAGCGLPGFANFVGEVMVFFGSWKPFPLVTVLAVWGALVIGAVYMLRAIRDILHGPPAGDAGAGAGAAGPTPGWADASSVWRRTPFVLLLGTLLLFGFVPGLLTKKITPSAERIVKIANGTPEEVTQTADAR